MLFSYSVINKTNKLIIHATCGTHPLFADDLTGVAVANDGDVATEVVATGWAVEPVIVPALKKC